jgi:hypothetical protein
VESGTFDEKAQMVGRLWDAGGASGKSPAFSLPCHLHLRGVPLLVSLCLERVVQEAVQRVRVQVWAEQDSDCEEELDFSVSGWGRLMFLRATAWVD